jgi:hypothetical protein
MGFTREGGANSHADPRLDSRECGHPAPLSPRMVLESINKPEHWLYTDLERCLLFKYDQIPPFTVVWIAKCVNFPSAYSISRTLSSATGQARAAVTTLAFGCLAIQVRKVVPRATMNPATSITVEEREGPWEQVTLQVWPPPPEPVRWPAPMGLLDEHGLETLADRFSPAGAGSRSGSGIRRPRPRCKRRMARRSASRTRDEGSSPGSSTETRSWSGTTARPTRCA